MIDEKLIKRCAALAKAAEDLAADGPSEDELEESGNHEWAEFFAECANIANAWANIPRREN